MKCYIWFQSHVNEKIDLSVICVVLVLSKRGEKNRKKRDDSSLRCDSVQQNSCRHAQPSYIRSSLWHALKLIGTINISGLL